jgi:hypothetical protein
MTETADASNGAAAHDDRYRMWDGAYVLGALIPEELREYELHLADCPSCRAAVAEIAMLPSLLARVPAPELDALSADADVPPLPESLRTPPEALLTPPAELLDRVLADGRRRARRGRARQFAIAAGSAVLAAAAAVAIAIPVVRHTTTTAPPTQASSVFAARTMQLLVSAPVTADFTLIDLGNGTTEVKMNCQYVDSAGPSYTNAYRMVVTTKSGNTEQVSRWYVHPGQQKYHPNGTVDLPAEQIRSVSITDDQGTPLMVGSV